MEIDLYPKGVRVVEEEGHFCVELLVEDSAGSRFIVHLPADSEMTETIYEVLGSAIFKQRKATLRRVMIDLMEQMRKDRGENK